MSDSEEDYMSDTFLLKCQDTRPGLVPDKLAKKYQKQSKSKEKQERSITKPLKVIEHEKRSEGLNQAIGEENKGFSLLQKMGYKPGMSLGKKGTGRAEPVPINLRTGRGGLGEDTERKRKQVEMASIRQAMFLKRKRRDETARRDFRAENSKKQQTRRAESDLYKSQRVCEQLDEQEGIELPDFKYFWTRTKMTLLKKQQEKDEESEEEEEDLNSVDMRTTRKDQPTHNQDDDDELPVNHRLHDEDEEEDEIEDIDVFDQLELLTDYLRSKYLYCVWCGTRYEDDEDIGQNCPGDNAELHDT